MDPIAAYYVPDLCPICDRVTRPQDWYEVPLGVRAEYRCDHDGERWFQNFRRHEWLSHGLPTPPHAA